MPLVRGSPSLLCVYFTRSTWTRSASIILRYNVAVSHDDVVSVCIFLTPPPPTWQLYHTHTKCLLLYTKHKQKTKTKNCLYSSVIPTEPRRCPFRSLFLFLVLVSGWHGLQIEHRKLFIYLFFIF